MSELLVPPHSIEAEQSLIGALLLDNSAWERVAEVVSSKDFYKGTHRKIYEHIELVLATDNPADVMTVSQSLQDAGVLDDCGGAAYLGAIAQNTPSAANVKRYAELVRSRAVQRNVVRICSEVAEQAMQPGADIDVVMEVAEQRIFELRHRRIAKQPRTFKQLLGKVFEKIDSRYHSDNKVVTGLAMGFPLLDEMTAGMQNGDLIIIAARPSMGKTALAMNIAEHAAIYAKRPVAIFSIEMADEQLVQRLLGSVGRVDQHNLRTGRLNNDDWSKLSSAMETLHDAPFIIEETSALTIVEMRARARRIARDNPGLGLIIVDYLQLMAGTAKNQTERTQEIGDISRGLKAIAKELDIPVIALSQLNRGVELRVNKRPVMSDLRDSGAIEQDADVVMFIYRDEVYNEESAEKGYAEIIVGKQRNGPIGHVHLQFVKEMTRFQNADGWTPPKRERKAKKGFYAKAEEEAKRKAEEAES